MHRRIETGMCEELFQYVLILSKRDTGAMLGRFPVKIDWTPVQEALTFKLIRQGALADYGQPLSIQIEPEWLNHASGQSIRGIQATALIGNDRSESLLFSIDYFRPQAQRVADRFVETGQLKPGDLFDYRVLALQPRAGSTAPLPRFTVEPVAMPARISASSLDLLMGRAILLGTGIVGDVPVFVHWRVLEEASVLTRQAGELETGGVLVGHLRRDPESKEVFLEITAQIPAHTDLN